jgi:recombination protein RecA
LAVHAAKFLSLYCINKENVQRLKNNKGEDRMKFCQNIHKEDFTKNDLVIGNLLGDSFIEKDGRIRVWHSINQKDYTLWLMNLYKKYFKVYYHERDCYLKETNKTYKQIGFSTSTTDYGKLVRMFFYCPNKKITLKQLKKLSPLGLAIWYMDDGCLSFIKDKTGKIKGRQLILNTQSFSFIEQELIVKYFSETWEINCKIHQDHNKYRIWMNGTEAEKFLHIIERYIPKCMYYKLCYRYYGYKSSKNLCNHQCEIGKCPYSIV